MQEYTAIPLFNLEWPDALTRGYREGDRMEPSKVFGLSGYVVLAESPEGAAEACWQALNRDDRPNGKAERSMCVGDVVAVYAGEGLPPAEGWITGWACESSGWREVEKPPAITIARATVVAVAVDTGSTTNGARP